MTVGETDRRGELVEIEESKVPNGGTDGPK